MKHALIFFLVSGGTAIIITLIVILRERMRKIRNVNPDFPVLKKIEYNPMKDIIGCTSAPYNENTDGDIDLVKQFYPAARIRRK